MLTPEGADDAEISVRPCGRGGWQIEIPGAAGITLRTVKTECEAIMLARELRPHAQVRILPALDAAEHRQNEES